MLQTWRKPAKVFSDFNTLQFAGVMSLVVFVMLLMFLTMPTGHCSTAVDLAKVFHPVSMRGADRGNAMRVSITRDGKVYFGTEQVTPANLELKLEDRLKDPEVEWKVYVVADARARWGSIKPVVESVRAAGLMRVAFLVDQRRSAALHM
jgi:biopolymer transport protein ExbD